METKTDGKKQENCCGQSCGCYTVEQPEACCPKEDKNACC